MKQVLITFCLKYKENQVRFNHCLQRLSLLLNRTSGMCLSTIISVNSMQKIMNLNIIKYLSAGPTGN